ncbi:MAG TPA: hypothetical protein PLF40_05915 [Kofleriaceae bacterium]|nr:hypothetical protein [Kofleriaceae bacterium]
MVANGDGNGARKLDDDAAMRLLSKLYDHDDDLDDVADEETPADAAGTEAGFRELRSVFAEMRESLAEEPPARGMEALLAAAAANVAKPAPRQAAVVEPEPGFFAKMRVGWMRLFAHPGMMAAAGLVVVVGVAGTIYFKTGAVDGGASDNETRSASTLAIEGRSAAQPEPATVNTDRQRAGATDSGSASAPALATDQPVKDKLAEASTKNKVVQATKPDLKSAKPSGKPASKISDRSGLGYQTGTGAGGEAVAEDAVEAEEEATPEAPAAQQPSPPPPPPPPPPAPVTKKPVAQPVAPLKVERASGPQTAPAQDNPPTTNTVPDTLEPSDKTKARKLAPTPASLLSAAKAAAAKGDCVRARALAEQARVDDKRAYDLALKDDAKLLQCFAVSR